MSYFTLLSEFLYRVFYLFPGLWAELFQMPTAATNEENWILFRIKKSLIINLHHRDVAGGILSLVTCSGPINIREAFWGVVVGFVAHTVDIS